MGVLLQSLTSLRLAEGFDTRWTIDVDVLPCSLQRLKVDVWTQPLSNIALPASLIALDIRLHPNHPLHVLPSQLRALRICGAFNQPLVAVLPASL